MKPGFRDPCVARSLVFIFLWSASFIAGIPTARAETNTPIQGSAENALAAGSSAWRALLHYEGDQSALVPGAPFFLDPNGHQDPAAELVATKRLLATPDGPCRFPARAMRLGIEPDGEGEFCERWRTWRDTIAAKGVELVFASAFVNSPSSMYGHTLLKFPRGGKTEGAELLDYTLNYGAHTGDSGGLSYVWKGLTGAFRGNFATAPYYLKVKEYLHVEKRDFWVYPLNTTPEETALLVAHAWELRDVSSPYYFLKKNCAYYLLQFLEVARPGQGLTRAFPLWAVPMDTIRRLRARDWLGEPRQRPARAKVLAERSRNLNAEERKQVDQLMAGTSVPDASARAIAAAYDLWRFRNDGHAGDAASRAAESSILRLLDRAAPAPSFTEAPPDEGHHSSRFGLAFGEDRRGYFGEIAYRGTLHDLLGDPSGFEPWSELSMGDFRFRWEDDKGFSLEHFDLLRIRSLAPWRRWMPSVAWSFRLGARANRELDCAGWHCTAGLLSAGLGAASTLGPLHFFSLVELDLEAGAPFRQNYRIGLGPAVGVYAPLWRGGRLLVEAEAKFRLLGDTRQRRELRVGFAQDIARNWELRAQGSLKKRWREAQLGLAAYF